MKNIQIPQELFIRLIRFHLFDMDEDADLVLRVIDEFEGVLPFNDRVSPEIIQREFGLSKNAFKRAVGRLLKEGRIQITENRIIRL